MGKTGIGIFVIIVSFVGLAINAFSTVLVPKTFRDLTKEADLVFIGTVTDIRYEWADEARNHIYEFVTFSNLEIIVGEHDGDEIVVRLSGGEIDDIKIEYDGIPEFEIGERDLIFLKGNFVEMCPIVGWTQGRFRVEVSQDSRGEIVLTDDFKPIGDIVNDRIITARDPKRRVMGSPGIPDDPGARVMAVEGPDKKMSVDSFVNAIRSLRDELKARGEILGYNPSVRVTTGIPKDAMGASAIRNPGREKVIGHGGLPEAAVLPPAEPDK